MRKLYEYFKLMFFKYEVQVFNLQGEWVSYKIAKNIVEAKDIVEFDLTFFQNVRVIDLITGNQIFCCNCKEDVVSWKHYGF